MRYSERDFAEFALHATVQSDNQNLGWKAEHNIPFE
jgi:hypothetical protein